MMKKLVGYLCIIAIGLIMFLIMFITRESNTTLFLILAGIPFILTASILLKKNEEDEKDERGENSNRM